MFVECGCITTDIELYTSFERSIFCLSTDINFTSLAFSLVTMLFSLEHGKGHWQKFVPF